MRNTAVIFFPAFDWAISPSHPEREERLLYTRDQIFEEGIMDLPNVIEYKPRLATDTDIARVHFCVPDISSVTTEAHYVSAGCSLVIADAVMSKQVDNGFSIARPPGHHSMTVVHGNRGFCNINNEAIMVEYIRKKYDIRRIAVVDTDVHHGDGSQEIFYHDPDILFISFHQDGRTLYPGSGFIEELGGPAALGSTINIPLRPKTSDDGILYIIDNLVLPMLKEFGAEVVVNSAGQDNHFTDPLADMRFSATGYAELNHRLKPDIAVLEGGYSIETALPYVNMGLIMAMAGLDYSNLREPDYHPGMFKESPSAMDYIKKLVDAQWHNFSSRDELVKAAKTRFKPMYSVTERIFYDTDYISEDQKNQIKICDDCHGYRLIDSNGHYRTGRDGRIFGVCVPIYACERCQAEAEKHYQKMISQHAAYDHIYLQDRKADRYLSYNCRTGLEKTIL